jgi:hypothetical protein
MSFILSHLWHSTDAHLRRKHPVAELTRFFELMYLSGVGRMQFILSGSEYSLQMAHFFHSEHPHISIF